MSDLQRSFARAHLSKLPPSPPHILDANVTLDAEDEEEDAVGDLRPGSPNDSSSSASSASSTGTVVPSPSRHLFEKPRK
jgi:protein phosphatase methylesterase 1